MSVSVLYHYKKIPKAGQLSKERRSFGSQFGDVKSKQCGKGSGEGLMADGGSTCDGKWSHLETGNQGEAGRSQA